MKTKDYLGDAMGAVSTNIIFNLAGLMIYFYTDVIGLSVSVVSVGLLLSKIFDAVSDVGMGVIVDRTKSKYGQARPWLLWAAVPTLLIFPVMFTIPLDASINFQLLYIAITNLLFIGVINTAIVIPYGTLIFLGTKEPHERAKIGVYRLTTAYIASSVVNIMLIPAVNAMGGRKQAWILMGCFYGLISMITLIITFFNTKERNSTEPTKREHIPLIFGIKLLLKNKYWGMILVVNLLINLIYSLANSASVYYSKYILGSADFVAIIGLSDLFFSFIGFFIIGAIVKKVSNRNIILFGMIVAVSGCVLRALNPYDIVYTIITRGITTIGGTTVLALTGALTADAIEYGEWKTGKRIVGLSSSVSSFGVKFGSAIWIGCSGLMLGMSGYDGTLYVQPHNANQMIIFLNIYFPFICYAAIIVIMVFYKLDRNIGRS